MVVNLIILLYWHTQRDRNIKPHSTEILSPCHILSALCSEAAVVWCKTLMGLLFCVCHFHHSASLAIMITTPGVSTIPHRWAVHSFGNDKGLECSESQGMRICWRLSKRRHN